MTPKALYCLFSVYLVAVAGCRAGTDPALPLFAPPSAVVRAQAAETKSGTDITVSLEILRTCFTQEKFLDLDGALRLADLENPTIGLAEEVVRANVAERMLARSLLFPNVNAGVTLAVHRGGLMTGSGNIIDVNRQSLYLGGGADVRGSGTLNIPALQLVGHLGDAIYVPRLANQKLESSRFDAIATRNNILLQVAQSYLALLGAEARLLAYRQSESEIGEVARLAADFAAKGQGRESDARRARSELLLLRGTAQRAEEDIALGTTELSRLLNLDPALRLRPEPGTPPLIQLVDDKKPLEVLVQMALAGRPEIAARSLDVAFNETRLQQERVRPLLPTIAVGVSAGDYGGGSNLAPYRFGHFGGRTDVDVLAVWTLQNFGMGNRALQNRARAQTGAAEAVRLRVINLVRQEVAEALTQARINRRQMTIAQRRVETSHKAYRQDLERARNLQGKLIEILNSLNLLTAARQDLIAEMIRYSQSQFQLHVALGGAPGS